MTVQFGIQTHQFPEQRYDRQPEPGPLQKYYRNLQRQVLELQDNPDAAEYQRLQKLVNGFDALRRAFIRTAPARADLNGFCSIMARSTPPVATRAADASRVVTFVANDFTLDRHGSRLRSGGIDTENFRRNPVFAFAHLVYGGWFSAPDPDAVIGKIKSWRVEGQRTGIVDNQKFVVDAEFAKDDYSDALYQKVRNGDLNAVSVGFIPQEISIQMEDGREVPIIERCELLEVSLTPLPSNPNALIVR
jgi:HK97 family phage prohead protease